MYYFPTKQALYTRVLDDVLDDWLARMASLADADQRPGRRAARLRRAPSCAFSREQPLASRVYAMEVIGGAKLYGEQIRRRVVPLLRADIAVFERWIADGKHRAGQRHPPAVRGVGDDPVVRRLRRPDGAGAGPRRSSAPHDFDEAERADHRHGAGRARPAHGPGDCAMPTLTPVDPDDAAPEAALAGRSATPTPITPCSPTPRWRATGPRALDRTGPGGRGDRQDPGRLRQDGSGLRLGITCAPAAS